jgi:hypothetical protein
MNKVQPTALHQGLDYGALQRKRTLLDHGKQDPTNQENRDRGPPVTLLPLD